MRALLKLLVFGLVAFLGAPSAFAATKEVVIVTSFPKEVFEAYKKAFEAARPGVRVVVKPQQTNAAITYLRETRAKPDADIFWASAVDAFQVLKADGLLEKVALPDAVLGHYFGFAVSGSGLAEQSLAEAKKLATAMPVDATRASDKEINAAFKDQPDVKSKLEIEWDNFAKTNYARAREAAERALAGTK